ncbi:MAG: hypothetical protein ABI702_19380 [Burkholderiales bacterium]
MAGSIDGACGPLALWSALIVLGIATRAQVICQKFLFTDDAFGEAWLRSLDVWFQGADDDEFDALLETVSRYVDHSACEGAMRKQLAFTVSRLRKNELVLLGLERRSGDGHWVLACGLEELVSEDSSEVIGILCLDSSEPAPQLLRYNARLELHVPQKGATFVRFHGVSGDTRSMTIDRAIALKRRPLPTRSPRRKEAGP